MILVTGATGLLGNNVVRMLVDRGQQVRVLVRAQADPRPLRDLAVEFAEGDVRDATAVERACRAVDRVIHCAGRTHIGRRDLPLQRAINVEGTRNVASAALRAGARMIHVSTIDTLGVDGTNRPIDELNPTAIPVPCSYAVSKREAEQAIHELIARGLDAVIVNPGFMLGPWDWKPSSGRILFEVARGRGLLAPPGANSYCDVRDVSAAILTTLDRARTGQRYILAGDNLRYVDALRIFARVTGGRPPIRVALPITVRLIGSIGDIFARVTGHESEVNSATTAMALLPKNYSSARAEAELGYRSRPLEQSATDAWAWFQQHGYVRGTRSKVA